MRIRNKALLVGGAVFATAACLALAQDQGIQAVIGNVFLQNATPGTSQIGHATITGTFRAGQVNVTQGSAVTIPVIANNTAIGPGSAVGGSFSVARGDGIALRATATASAGDSIGVSGTSRSSSGTGVFGQTTSTTGESNGVLGISFGPGGSGVRGLHASSSGSGGKRAGVAGFSNAANTPGVLGSNLTGVGVRGESDSNIGVEAETQSLTKGAVEARNIRGTGLAPAGSFTTSSSDGIAILAVATPNFGSSVGISAQSNSTINGTGVLGAGMDTGSNFGVYGVCASTNGFGVFSEGKTGASGTKSFVIDHPTDPENHYLVHYSTEGPEPLNFYSGTARTDGQGWATVQLPDYYGSVNRDPRIQLTVDDTSEDFVMCKVVGGVQNGRFRLRTSKPGTKVYWRLEAVRNDRWMQKYAYDDEPLKPEAFRGTYLHPELFGRPAARAQRRSGQNKETPVRP